MNKLILTTLGFVIAVGFALGCGSGDDEATSAGAANPLTKAQFIKQADAICAQISEKRTGALASWKKQSSLESKDELDAGLREVIAPSVRREAEELGTLVPPEEDAVEISQMIATLSKVSEELEREGSKTLTRPNLQKYKREAAAYGLQTCRFP